MEKQMLFRTAVVVGFVFAVWPAHADSWGAIAAYIESDSDGCSVGSASAWNYPTIWQAQNAAMQLCLRKSIHCSDAVSWQGSGVCGAIATAAWNDRNGRAWCAYGSGRGSSSGASQAAMRGCQLQGGV